MVAGLLSLVNGDSPYVWELQSSRYLVFSPVGLLYNCLRRSQAFNNTGAYGPDLSHAKVLFEGVVKDLLRCDLKPIFVFIGIPDKSVSCSSFIWF